MKRLHPLLTLLYATIAGLTIAISFFVLTTLTTLSYQIVTVFITLIVLSNCLAKLFMLHIYKQAL